MCYQLAEIRLNSSASFVEKEAIATDKNEKLPTGSVALSPNGATGRKEI